MAIQSAEAPTPQSEADVSSAEGVDTAEAFAASEATADRLLDQLTDDLDHPDLWRAAPTILLETPHLPDVLERRLRGQPGQKAAVAMSALLAVLEAVHGDVAAAIARLSPMTSFAGRSPLLQGAIFHLAGLLDPGNPKYRLEGRICPTPFRQIDVSERAAHLCCSGWLETSVGHPGRQPWMELWNGEVARSIRASILDGSYRYCNKGVCPIIQSDSLPTAESLRAEAPFWSEVLDESSTTPPQGPRVVNLAYDRTCNLSCPSCRKTPYAANAAKREVYDRMQEETILPMLKTASVVFITGSGDAFASKNFRKMMKQLTPELFPDLRFDILTNGMLFTPEQWEEFPNLHGRVNALKISIDAGTGPTHEHLRRGARWSVMLENMAFAGRLRQAGLIDKFELSFTVQVENYKEMGEAVDLAKSVGASIIGFSRIVNWGTFTDQEYADRAVFNPSHPAHDDFVAAIRDVRLRDPVVWLGNLQEFADGAA